MSDEMKGYAARVFTSGFVADLMQRGIGEYWHMQADQNVIHFVQKRRLENTFRAIVWLDDVEPQVSLYPEERFDGLRLGVSQLPEALVPGGVYYALAPWPDDAPGIEPMWGLTTKEDWERFFKAVQHGD